MFEILPLRQRPDLARTLAEWHYRQWGWMNPAKDTDIRVAEFRHHLEPGRVPTSFVALVDGTPAGSASLIECDMETRAHLTPWLASVYVDPGFRRRGIASALVDRVVAEAAAIGIPQMYLFTPDMMTLYGALGWQEIEQVEYRGELETIMSIVPAARVAWLSQTESD